MCDEAQIREALQTAFNEVDTDKSGSIDAGEFKNALIKANLKPTDEDIQFIFKHADRDQSGRLSFDEFAEMIMKLSLAVKVAMELRALFEAIDQDGSGFITADELKKLIKQTKGGDKITDAQIDELLKACDDNGDGKISFEEFIKNFVQ